MTSGPEAADSDLGATLLDLAIRAAHAAGSVLMSFYGKLSEFDTKSSATDPVSEADRSSEALLVSMLLAERPDDGLIGEEGASRTSTSGITWVLDPLDGTVNYLYQLGHFSVSVAAEDADGGLVGVVHDPLTGRTFTGERGKGAFLDGTPLRANDPVPMGHALVATGFSYDTDRRAAQGRFAASLLPQIRDLRRLGSAALDLCAVASGAVDAYFEEGVNHWDIAAGGLIAQEAGALMTHFTPSGGPSGWLAAGPALHHSLVRLSSSASEG